MSQQEYMKQYYQEHKEIMKKQSFEWMKDNKVKHNKLVMNHFKKVNYKYEKTPMQLFIRRIRSRTRYHFPLSGQSCESCGDIATERHHNTQPIEVDKFNFLCKSCHKNIHNLNKIGGKIWET